RFYSIRKDLPDDRKAVLDLLSAQLKSDTRYNDDLGTLKECTEFQKKAGKCDMKTLQSFIKWKQGRTKNV
ncbi:MAG: hypothetical protein HZC49_03225, partial [Nitrospirae bacterium]|nr:hypothetical protein [Nitrospirota bacterium]